MMEDGPAPVRRSRRAASLTAQVLWGIQMQEDSKLSLRSGTKTTSVKEKVEVASTSSKKRGRKRKVSEAIVPEQQAASIEDSETKQKKMKPSCSGSTFSLREPLAVDRESKPKAKLTASVAPLIKPQSSPIKIANAASPSVTTVTNANPILLLPVSLQGSQGNGAGDTQGLGGLSLVTLQAPAGFLNCLNLNKPLINPSPPHEWNIGAATQAKAPQMTSFRYNIKGRNPVLTGLAPPQIQKQMPVSHSQGLNESVTVQIEPLNLKVGETTVPDSSVLLTQKQTTAPTRSLRPVAVNLPRILPKKKMQMLQTADQNQGSPGPSKAKQQLNPRTKQVQANTAASKFTRESVKLISTTIVSSKQTSLASTSKKQDVKCPSPDYACSSPDVDDVNLNPRHSCNKRRINLRKKAAPRPGSLEYATFVEEQRRLLMEIKRAQRAKALSKAKHELKASKVRKKSLKEEDDDDNRPLTSPPDTRKLHSHEEEKRHDWEWWGNPYTALVFSVEHGRYVSRCCYPGIRRKDKDSGCSDIILVRDSVFLQAEEAEDLSYVAKVCALWENANTKDMMISVLWYYRPEQTREGKELDCSEDEIFVSKHQDEISVACIEQRCKVLTYSQFCRMHAKLNNDRMFQRSNLRRLVPPITDPKYWLCRRPLFFDEEPLDPQDMFFSRYLYDVHSHRVRLKLPLPISLCPEPKRGGVTSVA